MSEDSHPENDEVISDIRQVMDDLQEEISEISNTAIQVYQRGIEEGIDRDKLIIFFVTSLTTSCSVAHALAGMTLAGINIEMLLHSVDMHDAENLVRPIWVATASAVMEWRSLASMDQRMHMENVIDLARQLGMDEQADPVEQITNLVAQFGGGQDEPASAPQPPTDG